MTFQQLSLSNELLRALEDKKYSQPTPIQQQSIPVIFQGKDIFGMAQTGTGKTAAFALPILQKLAANKEMLSGKRAIRSLILAPTRELALQIHENFIDYGKYLPIRTAVIFGGVSQKPQTDKLRNGVDVLIATPGRLLDLIQQGFIKLNKVEIFVLDEADRMLDMGFIADIRRILPMLPAQKQTLFFSATAEKEIKKLADSILKQPQTISTTPVSTPAQTVQQSVYFVMKESKPKLLMHLLQDKDIDHTLIFTRTKHGANKVEKALNKGGIKAVAIHGNKSQNARQNALNGFKDRSVQVLVATDIASRGIDVDRLSHVINYDIPNEPETYVHRIGRTGRAGNEGEAISFCDAEEVEYLNRIEKLIQKPIQVVGGHPFEMFVDRSAPLSVAPSSQRKPQHKPNKNKSGKKPFWKKKKSTGVRK